MRKYGFQYGFTVALAVAGLLLTHPTARGQTAPAATRAEARQARRWPADVGATADEVALTTLDGRPTSWRVLRGKVVVVYLWASWCPPCLAGLPELATLARETDAAHVAVVLLALDADAAPVRAALASSANALPVYLAAAAVPDAFAPPSLPSVVVLRPNGQVAAHYAQLGEYNTPTFKAALHQLAHKPRH